MHQSRPARGYDSTSPGARQRGGGIYTPLPVGCYKELVAPVLLVAVQHHRGTLGSVAVLQESQRALNSRRRAEEQIQALAMRRHQDPICPHFGVSHKTDKTALTLHISAPSHHRVETSEGRDGIGNFSQIIKELDDSSPHFLPCGYRQKCWSRLLRGSQRDASEGSLPCP